MLVSLSLWYCEFSEYLSTGGSLRQLSHAPSISDRFDFYPHSLLITGYPSMLLRHHYRPLILPSDQAHLKLDRKGYPAVALSSISKAVVAVNYELILVPSCQVVQHKSV